MSVSRLYLNLYRDGWTGGLQLAIEEAVDGEEKGGYRIFGPKFNGSGALVVRHGLRQRDADELRSLLARAFPVTPKPPAPGVYVRPGAEPWVPCDFIEEHKRASHAPREATAPPALFIVEHSGDQLNVCAFHLPGTITHELDKVRRG